VPWCIICTLSAAPDFHRTYSNPYIFLIFRAGKSIREERQFSLVQLLHLLHFWSLVHPSFVPLCIFCPLVHHCASLLIFASFVSCDGAPAQSKWKAQLPRGPRDRPLFRRAHRICFRLQGHTAQLSKAVDLEVQGSRHEVKSLARQSRHLCLNFIGYRLYPSDAHFFL
jgi:hypothetical protein